MIDRHKNRKAHNRVELTGRKFGKLTVLNDSGLKTGRRPIWICQCDCGNTANVSSKYLLCGDTLSCGCSTQGNAHNRDAVGEITKSFWTPLIKQAQRRGITVEITREEAWELFLKQNRKCALSGVEIAFARNFRDERSSHTVSLDRIDSSKTYSLDNVQWVHKKINIMKNIMNNDEFRSWCKLVNENSQ